MRKLVLLGFALVALTSIASAQDATPAPSATPAPPAGPVFGISGYERANFALTGDSNQSFSGTLANRLRLNIGAKDAEDTYGFASRIEINTKTNSATASGVDQSIDPQSFYGYVNLFNKTVKISGGKLQNFDYDLSSGIDDFWFGAVANDYEVIDHSTYNLNFKTWYQPLVYQNGLLLQVFPIAGLNLGVALLPKNSTLKVSLGDLNISGRYDIKDVGSIIVESSFADDIAHSRLSASFDLTAVKGLDVALGFKGLTDMSIYSIINISAGNFGLQVAPEYYLGTTELHKSGIYAEGYASYAINDLTLEVLGAYDQNNVALSAGSHYMVGVLALYNINKVQLRLGVSLDEAQSFEIPFTIKVSF